MSDRPVRSSRWRQHLLRGRDERGLVSLLTIAVTPVILLMIFGVVQGALYYYARTVALAAAQEGLRDAQVEDGTASAGAARARDFLARSSDGFLTGVQINPTRSATTASVTVQGLTLSVLPGVPGLRVSQTADGPIERYTAPLAGTATAALR